MAKRRKPKIPAAPLLIIDDRNRPDEAWIPADQLPEVVDTGWVSKGYSDKMVVCHFAPDDRHPILILASYDFDRNEWRTAMGPVENVTHWQYPPEFPKEYHE